MARLQEDSFAECLRNFSRDVGRFPSDSEGLDALVTRPAGLEEWRGPYLDEPVPDDPWGRAYVYRLEAPNRAVMTCLGSDGAPGGSGFGADIVVTVFSRDN
jgi:general secretion pathway protein G